METLVVVAQHRNQFHSRSKAQGNAPFGSSSPTRDFRGINCRTFQTGTGILPTPLKSYTSAPVTKRPSPSPSSSPSSSSSPSPKSPSPPLTPSSSSSDYKPFAKIDNIATPKSAPIAINGRAFCRKGRTFSDEHVVVPGDGSMFFSELWAGPTYSNSPPPSSLPIPKFSVRPKRTVSLDLPGSSSPEIDIHPVAKSAPASPGREPLPSVGDLFDTADSATKMLRRILNLNLDDD